MRRAIAVGLLLLLVLLPVLATGEVDDNNRDEIWAVRKALVTFLCEMSALLKTIQYETGVSISLKLQIKETLIIIEQLLELLKG